MKRNRHVDYDPNYETLLLFVTMLIVVLQFVLLTRSPVTFPLFNHKRIFLAALETFVTPSHDIIAAASRRGLGEKISGHGRWAGFLRTPIRYNQKEEMHLASIDGQ